MMCTVVDSLAVQIPASAVEMPGAMNYRVDVQFGNWDGPTETSFGFGTVTQSPAATIVGNNYTRFVHVCLCPHVGMRNLQCTCSARLSKKIHVTISVKVTLLNDCGVVCNNNRLFILVSVSVKLTCLNNSVFSGTSLNYM